jgi:undecaprenyl diphosphate synthase
VPEQRSVPAHVGIIMDGNGRWAKARGLPRTEGHRRGTENAKLIVQAAIDLGIRCLSLYVFSTENWKRAADEVGFLMGLIKQHLTAELDFYRRNRIRVVHSGDPAGLPEDVVAEIRQAERDTASFDRFTVNLAINYGGRDEIVRAVRRALASGAANAGAAGRAGAAIDEAAISAAMDHPELPDPDLIVRTSGELRVSNFLLWESAYAELHFSDKYWPDFGPEDLAEAVRVYGQRERRYGGRP